MKFPQHGLYAITQCTGKTNETIIQEVDLAIKGGACVIQYRDKRVTDHYFLALALQALCKQHQIPFIINDNIDLACRIQADGVHLGKDDGMISLARKQLGTQAIIGFSCYNAINSAIKAEAEGANYLAFGRFFPSSSKPLAAPAQQETLRLAKKTIKVPIVAIGGILPENGRPLLNNGADVLAVIGGIFNQAPEQSARQYQTLFSA